MKNSQRNLIKERDTQFLSSFLMKTVEDKPLFQMYERLPDGFKFRCLVYNSLSIRNFV